MFFRSLGNSSHSSQAWKYTIVCQVRYPIWCKVRIYNHTKSQVHVGNIDLPGSMFRGCYDSSSCNNLMPYRTLFPSHFGQTVRDEIESNSIDRWSNHCKFFRHKYINNPVCNYLASKNQVIHEISIITGFQQQAPPRHVSGFFLRFVLSAINPSLALKLRELLIEGWSALDITLALMYAYIISAPSLVKPRKNEWTNPMN